MSNKRNAGDEVYISPLRETEMKLELYDQMQSIAEITEELERLRERAALVARKRDIDYVMQLDEVVETILSTLVDNKANLANFVTKILQSGNARHLKELMVALGVTIDKREALLGFDQERSKGGQKKKMRFEVLWKGGDGSQAGVKIEEL